MKSPAAEVKYRANLLVEGRGRSGCDFIELTNGLFAQPERRFHLLAFSNVRQESEGADDISLLVAKYHGPEREIDRGPVPSNATKFRTLKLSPFE